MPLQIVLVHPLIPQNTGSIGRLTAATNSLLHLIEPLGFELSDRYLKRAGLDYWQEIKLMVHPSWEEFLSSQKPNFLQLSFFSKKGVSSYHESTFTADHYLVFGNEEQGFPEPFYRNYEERLFQIPMDNPQVRSLNLSCAASIVLYEARRQLGLLDKRHS